MATYSGGSHAILLVIGCAAAVIADGIKDIAEGVEKLSKSEAHATIKVNVNITPTVDKKEHDDADTLDNIVDVAHNDNYTIDLHHDVSMIEGLG